MRVTVDVGWVLEAKGFFVVFNGAFDFIMHRSMSWTLVWEIIGSAVYWA
jgi:hypothetical protein